MRLLRRLLPDRARLALRPGYHALRRLYWRLKGLVRPPGLRGFDLPRPGGTVPRGAVRIAGWALDADAPLARVEVTAGDAHPERARMGFPNPFVATAVRTPEANVCGFELLADLSELPPDRDEVAISATAIHFDGGTHEIGAMTVRVAPPEPASAGPAPPEARAPASPSRLGRSAGRRSTPSPRPAAPRTLVFTHDLGYGGGQLYLHELLVRLVRAGDAEVSVLSPRDGPLRAELEQLGAEVQVIPAVPVSEAARYERAVEDLVRRVGDRHFDVALANTMGSFPGVDAAGRLGIPAVWSIHESFPLEVFWWHAYPEETVDPHVKARARAVLAGARAVVFEADATRRLYERHGDPARFVTVPYGIDVEAIEDWRSRFDRAAARARLGLPAGATVVLCLGTVEPRKAQAVLARAFAQVADEHPDALLALVGDIDSAYSRALHDYVDESGLAERIRMVPVTPDTYDWYGVADLFAIASDVESLPRSVLEVMAFQVPVLATSVFGLPELLTDGATGYLVEPLDLAALAAALDRLLATPAAARAEVGRAGAALVRRRHHASGYAGDYARLLAALADDPLALPRPALESTPV